MNKKRGNRGKGILVRLMQNGNSHPCCIRNKIPKNSWKCIGLDALEALKSSGNILGMLEPCNYAMMLCMSELQVNLTLKPAIAIVIMSSASHSVTLFVQLKATLVFLLNQLFLIRQKACLSCSSTSSQF